MDQAAQVLEVAHNVYARANSTSSDGDDSSDTRPASFKIIGIGLAIASGCFIGTSFVLKKVGLLRANEKYSEVAGEGYGYLKNAYWWSGMTLMIVGEICNFAAYAFTEAILVTSLGALSVVITTVLSAIFLKERLSLVGKVACFLCVVGSVVIVLNAPTESSVADIQELKTFVVTPGFLSYTGVIVVGAVFLAFWAGPRYGKKNMFTYISICSWIGGLSVVATQGLGAAIVAQIGGEPQFNHWFLYIVLIFVICTLLTEIIFLNKALNLFNAAMVTPTYYVYFTSTTIISSAVLFQGFKGTADAIITVVMGFLTICSGVVLLQLSKSAKDVPDTAVFNGDLNQIQTIAEQEQPETEPKADAIRGAAAIVRRLSAPRKKWEAEEFRRLREEKEKERLAPVSEDGQEQFEWDGLRRRRTTVGSHGARSFTLPTPATTPAHPPLGRSRHFTEEELEEDRNRQMSPGVLTSIAGTIRSRARSVLNPAHPDLPTQEHPDSVSKMQSPMHPVQLTDIAVPSQKYGTEASPYGYGISGSPKTAYGGAASVASGSTDRHIQFAGTPKPSASMASLVPPTPPPHGEHPSARRQFSFQNVFRRHQADRAQEQSLPTSPGAGGDGPSPRHGTGHRGYSDRQIKQVKNATEEETLGLVKGDSHSTMPARPRYGDDDDDYSDDYDDDDDDDYDGEGLFSDDRKRAERYGRGITNSSPQRRRGSDGSSEEGSGSGSGASIDDSRRGWHKTKTTRSSNRSKSRTPRSSPPRPPPAGGRRDPPPGGDGAFI
ncbi:magnesium transporter NIPA-domain-containing protein [Xylariaceae sp. FL0804]|nr:magnesium transporter NIPA-domain-containing protein [Xylariaceae sp. FL0804]